MNMLSAITVSLVAEARQGPFVFHAGLEDACQQAAELGFDAIEVFPPSGDALAGEMLPELLRKYGVKLAAVGTGAGWVRHQWSLTATDEAVRAQARQFIRGVIAAAGKHSAPAIIGSMQGKYTPEQGREPALRLLADQLGELSEFAHGEFGTMLLIEPLNRYESNVLNRVDETAVWLEAHQLSHVKILADLFHMNIEEADMAAALRAAGSRVGHVHFADSNRWAVGAGHAPLADAVRALVEMGYAGYLSAEIFPRPDSRSAAELTIRSFRELAPQGTQPC
jgi:sugar phosphate isomerase/epimerase